MARHRSVARRYAARSSNPLCTIMGTVWTELGKVTRQRCRVIDDQGGRTVVSNDEAPDTKAVASAEVLFEPLLIFLTADAQSRLRSRLEALDGDLLLAFLTDAKRTVVDLCDGLVDLVEERLFPST